VSELYTPAQRDELAALLERVWGAPQERDELAWWHEQPQATTLLERDGDRVVGAVTMSLVTLQLRGEAVPAGIATRLATDPQSRGKGVFARLQRESEARAEAAGARLLLVVPNAASKPIFLGKLGWSELEPLRVRFRPLPGRRAPEVAALRALPPREGGLVRDDAYLAWRFGRRYRFFQDERGYLAQGRRGPLNVVAATGGDPPLPGRALATRGLPTPKAFSVLARSLGEPLPPRVGLELGDLDFL
jgi:predicted N-acetyltransferase YhbS